MWPPTDDDFKLIAQTVNNSEKTKNKQTVLVYWDNKELIIFDPIHFANTDYKEQTFLINNNNKSNEIKIIIGKED